MSILGDLLHGSLEPPSKRHPGLGGAFDAWFLKACHRSPSERFASGAEQIESLSAALGMPRLAIETPRAPLAEALRHRPRVVALIAAAGLLVVAIVAAAFLHGRSPARVMMAMLPFENLTGDPDQEYFSAGLTDGMIGQLGRLAPERLAVIARTSVTPEGLNKAIGYYERAIQLDPGSVGTPVFAFTSSACHTPRLMGPARFTTPSLS